MHEPCRAGDRRSSTSSRPRARSTCRGCSPKPARRPGRTRGSAYISPSSPTPAPTYACASWKAGAAGARSALRAYVPPRHGPGGAGDVDAKKVGQDLAHAIEASENNTIKFADVPPTGIIVQRGHTFDGLGDFYREIITESDEEPVDVAQTLRDAQVDVLVSYLPVGSEDSDRFYAQACLDAKVAFVNALPVFIASDPVWAQKFTDAAVAIVGDDIKSQVGATITHRVMAKLFEDRGVELQRTYQLNFGGNMDFMNMLERKRLQSKKISKTQSVTSQLPHEMAKADVHIGPSDHVPWLDDRNWAYVRLEGRSFGDTPLNLEYKLEVGDSPNSAGVILDPLRAPNIPNYPRTPNPPP